MKDGMSGLELGSSTNTYIGFSDPLGRGQVPDTTIRCVNLFEFFIHFFEV